MKLTKKQLTKLQNEWNKKLKVALEEAGTPDIEYYENSKPQAWVKKHWRQKSDSNNASVNYKQENFFEQNSDYYSMCREMLHYYPFRNETERLIFEMHSEGATYRTIGEQTGYSHVRCQRAVQRILTTSPLISPTTQEDYDIELS